MIRLLFPTLLLAIQGAGIAAGAICYGPICDWATSGYWVSPAVRVPVVAAGVIVAEVALLAIAWPGARWGADRFTRRDELPLTASDFNPHAFDAAAPKAAAAIAPAQTR